APSSTTCPSTTPSSTWSPSPASKDLQHPPTPTLFLAVPHPLLLHLVGPTSSCARGGLFLRRIKLRGQHRNNNNSRMVRIRRWVPRRRLGRIGWMMRCRCSWTRFCWML
ncbi:hypothetical protein HK102_012914, partial [Quaeritorhiza haematococci]